MMSICVLPMVVISFSTLCALLKYSWQERTSVYFRLIVAAALMNLTYIATLANFTHLRTGHHRFNSWFGILFAEVSAYLWPLLSIPTLLYTWQIYDLIERAANMKEERKWGFWLRSGIIGLIALGVFSLTIYADVYGAMGIWYKYPRYGNQDT